MTIRETAIENAKAEAPNAARKSHERNYEKLHVSRGGSVSWFESPNRTDDLIDGDADHFVAAKSVITVGTGSFACNCMACEDETSDDAIADLEDAIIAAFDQIEDGYFFDERAE